MLLYNGILTCSFTEQQKLTFRFSKQLKKQTVCWINCKGFGVQGQRTVVQSFGETSLGALCAVLFSMPKEVYALESFQC